jgi:hypothetical protein
VGVFDSKLPHQFVVCMWTSGQRNTLARRATQYDAVIVLGCDSAAATMRGGLPPGYRVIQGMEVEGIMSVIPRAHLPFDVSLEVAGVTRVLQPPRIGSMRPDAVGGAGREPR